MSEPTIGRRTLDGIAANLRTLATAAKDNAANRDIEGDTTEAEHWSGRAAGLTDAYDIITAVLSGSEAAAYRVRDRVTVTYKSRTGTWDGTVIHMFSVADRTVYVVRPDNAGPNHRGHMVEAEQMAPAGQERVS